ncbi:aminodeoxychorismate/anthranilate synthase component II [Actinomyces sp.]|uniref:anthranilate synthase component II n=1 Tax=Actinomyces sp. TaxID=29317 RepID=UPI0026DC99B4|nr:gamma-glutamyl-gamma-aminobutyrate hydrolase family protein [Actinomyces sp.]MDO4900605.1 gamma-glutamyl-gamma-aminobutyrate hydrolase family protein [Actinomyces sp.]
MHVVLLDNRDSFVYNLVDQFASLGASIEVYRNTAPAATVLRALEPGGGHAPTDTARSGRPVLCLSPGPGHPRTSGNLMELIHAAVDRTIPTLGICLGFQAIVEACGGAIGRVGPVHGRSVRVELTEAGRTSPAFQALPDGRLDVARYHSLGTRELPAALTPLAVTTAEDPVGSGVVMAARHRSRPVVGLQFHPESVLTPQGPGILHALTADLAAAAAT